MQHRVFASLAVLTLLMFTFLPNNAIAEGEWQVYKVNYNGQVFKIPYKITYGELSAIKIDKDFSAILVYIKSDPKNDSAMEITIPRNLIDAKTYGEREEIFTILLDGSELSYNKDYKQIGKSPCFRTLSIPFHSGASEIEIIASQVPESPPQVTDVPAIHIVTSKNNYDVGETIAVSGCTNLALDDKELILEVLNPQGQIYKTVSVAPNIDGTFSTSFPVEGGLATNETYTVKATYAGHSATNSFIVPEFPIFSLIVFACATSLILAMRLMRKLPCVIS